MWYSNKYFLTKNNEYENILIELNNYIEQNKRFSDRNIKNDMLLKSLALSGKSVSFIISQLLKFYPDLKPMVDGLNRFLFGNGKGYKLPIKLFSQEVKTRLLRMALREPDWKENEKTDFLWLYDDYINAYGYYLDEDVIGNDSNYRDPLRYIIGGFTPQVWWDKDNNGDINIYTKIIDKYDWKEKDITNIKIELPDNEKIKAMVNNIINIIAKLNIDCTMPRIEDSSLVIPDSFFSSLQSAGICKPYINSFEGKILTLKKEDFPEITDAKDRLSMLSMLSYTEFINTENFSILRYLLDNNYEIKCTEYIQSILDISKKYLTIDDVNKIMKLANTKDLSDMNFYIRKFDEIKNVKVINYMSDLGCDIRFNIYNNAITFDRSLLNELKLIINKSKSKDEFKNHIINDYDNELVISNIDYYIQLLDLSVDNIYYMANGLYRTTQNEQKVIDFLSTASKLLPIDPKEMMNDIKNKTINNQMEIDQ